MSDDTQDQLDFDNLPEDEPSSTELVPAEGEEKAGNAKAPLASSYQNWFLEYASYVILDRAVPALLDGLKPVQRRIMHSLRELDDGRYNKVANVVGHSMRYHPHGDASIYSAMVGMGQRNLLIDTQGNWGNTLTGDGAAAARYIEARLSPFAREVVFNPKTTHWQQSYDGRNKEPINLPVKFPLLLSEGAEGIAVGLACKILPHNFNEIIDAAIYHLNGDEFELYPDFETGGIADFSNYNDGLRGGRVLVRAVFEKVSKYQLVIREIPFGCTTGSLIDSIISANSKGKIKIKKIEDNTSDKAEIIITLPPGTEADDAIDALYLFTDCQVSIAPNACIIQDDKPQFIGVSEILRRSTDNVKALLKRELEIKLAELEEKWHFDSLERIFIEERIYRRIEECETWDAVISEIHKGLDPFKPQLKREVTDDDVTRLTEIRIKRISKFNSFKANEEIKKTEKEMRATKRNLKNLTKFATDYFEDLKEKYGKGRERRTKIESFETIKAAEVALPTQKLYVNREDGFIGFSLKKDEFLCEASQFDELIAFCADGTFRVSRAADKVFMGKDILHVAPWKKGDEETIYDMVYRDGPRGPSYVKRFIVNAVTRDKEYDLTKGTKGSKVHYFKANPDGKSKPIKVRLTPSCSARVKEFDFDLGELMVKGRGSKGNMLTKYAVKTIRTFFSTEL
ncbi:DNA gyrase/topoisomerase IV subunit A [Pelagicoccus sp. SDUM812005]|uniref:DNA gyrase/topoisomerase IV subunit A n=1 Tax=Pelagicoccus sp. SDUM812005 TaxID=3041257 RepID=UPI00280CF2E4|nr:DNA gyrase/topoisomerase IV subunit A [Pelagicoccus sp. SDUM812005]MDQ8179508.1 DNA gyrase/topoisomerase IV subunit A [Pelagicoccus sp. SDUM812005]